MSIVWLVYARLQCSTFEFKKIICPSGSGTTKPPKGQHGGKGLCQSLPGFYIQVHFWQLPWTLFPANRPGKKRYASTLFSNVRFHRFKMTVNGKIWMNKIK